MTAEPAPLFPEPLRPGDAIRLVAPAGPFNAPLVWRALGWLKRHYRIRYDRGIFTRHGYFAGDDERRLNELRAALCEPGVKAVLCARGGYGVSRFAHHIDWSILRRHPRWLVGFSDITALHVEAAAVGVASIHGCNATGLGRADAIARDDFRRTLAEPLQPKRHPLTTLRPGHAEGPLFGGNLTLLHACAAAGRLRVPDGCILFLEDVTELPYRLDRAITTLLVGGHLQGVAGVVLGQLTDCRPGRDGIRAQDMLQERLAELDVPIATGLSAGHGLPNHAMVLLQTARLEANEGDAQLLLSTA